MARTVLAARCCRHRMRGDPRPVYAPALRRSGPIGAVAGCRTVRVAGRPHVDRAQCHHAVAGRLPRCLQLHHAVPAERRGPSWHGPARPRRVRSRCAHRHRRGWPHRRPTSARHRRGGDLDHRCAPRRPRPRRRVPARRGDAGRGPRSIGTRRQSGADLADPATCRTGLGGPVVAVDIGVQSRHRTRCGGSRATLSTGLGVDGPPALGAAVAACAFVPLVVVAVVSRRGTPAVSDEATPPSGSTVTTTESCSA